MLTILIYHNLLPFKLQMTELLIKWLIFFKWYTQRHFVLFNLFYKSPFLTSYFLNDSLTENCEKYQLLKDFLTLFWNVFEILYFSCHILSFLRTLDQKARPINTLICFDQVKTCLISIQEIWSKIFRTIAKILNCILSDQLRF